MRKDQKRGRQIIVEIKIGTNYWYTYKLLYNGLTSAK